MLRTVTTALSAISFALALTGCQPAAQQNGSPEIVTADLAALHPDVRAAALRARETEAACEEAAQRAREAAEQGQAAAERARRGEAGFLVGARDPSDPSAARYEGTVDASGIPTGFGVVYFGAGQFQGDTRAGEFGDATRARPGVYQYGNNSNPNAQAALRYEGDFLNEQRNGYGLTYWRDGARSATLLRDGAGAGPGVYRFADGRRYEGDHEQGLPSGHGVQWGSNGEIELQGLWQNGELVVPMSP